MPLQASSMEQAIRYVALGDSYTVGTGVQHKDAWPAVLTKLLQKKGAHIELVGNLGHNGWTTQNLIDQELPLAKILEPDYITLLIGTNDWVQGVDAPTFRRHLSYILDEAAKILSNPKNIIVITTPDFSVTPTGKQFANGRDIAQGIADFNKIIMQEARARDLNVVDLYALSQQMGTDSTLLAGDGLHPSPKAHAQWADLISAAFSTLLHL